MESTLTTQGMNSSPKGKETQTSIVSSAPSMTSDHSKDTPPCMETSVSSSVLCDVGACSGSVVKRCLTCNDNYCEIHVKDHLKDLGSHELQDLHHHSLSLCPKHHKELEFYCTTDQSTICSDCLLYNHRQHDVIEQTPGLLDCVQKPSQSLMKEGPPLMIVLIGKTGMGKSATGNTILGREAFQSRPSDTSVTFSSERLSTTTTSPREIVVVDTPGVLDTNRDEAEVREEILQCIKLSAPGPHAFLLVTPVGRFTKEDQVAVRALQELFGEKAKPYMIVLITRGDDLDYDRQGLEQYVSRGPRELQEVIQSCGGGCHVFNNKEISDRTQVVELVKKIDEMVAANGGQHFTDEMYEETTRVMEERGLRWNSSQIDQHLSFLPLLRKRVEQFQKTLNQSQTLNQILYDNIMMCYL